MWDSKCSHAPYDRVLPIPHSMVYVWYTWGAKAVPVSPRYTSSEYSSLASLGWLEAVLNLSGIWEALVVKSSHRLGSHEVNTFLSRIVRELIPGCWHQSDGTRKGELGIRPEIAKLVCSMEIP